LAVPAEILFTLPGGGVAKGREAQWVVDLLRAYKAAGRAGQLHHTQVHLAENADRLLDALAGVGIAALIDEATGYQEQRKAGALARLFERIFGAKPSPWESVFADSLVAALCALDGVLWSGGSHPRHLASTNAKIYDYVFSTEIGRELRARNPEPRHGKNHHQLLSPDASAYLKEQLAIVEVIARQSSDKVDFWSRMDRQYRGAFLQLGLPEAL
jgi:hypothetical protein